MQISPLGIFFPSKNHSKLDCFWWLVMFEVNGCLIELGPKMAGFLLVSLLMPKKRPKSHFENLPYMQGAF